MRPLLIDTISKQVTYNNLLDSCRQKINEREGKSQQMINMKKEYNDMLNEYLNTDIPFLPIHKKGKFLQLSRIYYSKSKECKEIETDIRKIEYKLTCVGNELNYLVNNLKKRSNKTQSIINKITIKKNESMKQDIEFCKREKEALEWMLSKTINDVI